MDQTPAQPSSPRAQLEKFLGVDAHAGVRRGLLAALGLGLLAILAVAVWLLVRGHETTTRYTTALVERGDLEVSVSATGNLAPTNKVEVGSEISGIITDILVDSNDRVSRGQVLARLDTSRLTDAVRQSEAALVSAEAGVAQAEATLEETTASLARLEQVYRLSSGKAPAVTELDAARAAQSRAAANLRAARAAVGQAQATLSSNRTQLAKATIRSPVDGVVLSRAVEPGQTVAASFNAPVLFTLAEDLSRMKLEVKVDEADVGLVKAGQRATFQVDAYPGRSFSAVVQRLDLGATTTASSSGSGQVVAYTAVLTADNPDLALRPGMTGTASIVTAEKRGVLFVPNAALRFRPSTQTGNALGGISSMLVPHRPGQSRGTGAVGIGRGARQTVYVLEADDQLRPVNVQVGDSNGSVTEAPGGELKPGMKVVIGELAGKAKPS